MTKPMRFQRGEPDPGLVETRFSKFTISVYSETVASDIRVIESILSATVELDSGYILRL